MSNLVQRSLTGILFVLVLVGGIVLSPMTFAAVFAAVTGLTVWEFSTIVNRHGGAQVNRFINTVAAVYLFFAFFGYCSNMTGAEAFVFLTPAGQRPLRFPLTGTSSRSRP